MELAEINEALEANRRERIAKVEAGLKELLESNKCRLEPAVTIDMQGTHFVLNIIPME